MLGNQSTPTKSELRDGSLSGLLNHVRKQIRAYKPNGQLRNNISEQRFEEWQSWEKELEQAIKKLGKSK